MKILHITGTMAPASGGICQAIRNSNAQLLILGASREVVCLDHPESSFIGRDDFPIHAIGPAKNLWQYSPKLKPWLLANLSNFDVIIVNGIWIYTNYAIWRVIKALKKQQVKNPAINIPKVFIMPHGMLDPYFQLAPNRRLKAIRNWFYWKIIEGKTIRNADGVLFTCETELKLARTTFSPYQPKKEINVGYGIIPPPAFSPTMHLSLIEKCPEVANEPYLLFFGRIHEKKGIDLLIKSYLTILKQLSHKLKIPKLVIAGPGISASFGKSMINLVNKHSELKGLVLFPGMLTGDAKWGALYGCDAFLLPSHQENFGIAVVEAMACKKPVLISQQINIWAEINAGGGGIVGPDTVEGTTNSLIKWLNLSVTAQRKMGEQAFLTFKEHFHVESAAVTFLKALTN